jgi:hypothetical protein
MARSELSGQPNGAGNVDARRAAETKPLMFEQVEDERDRFFIADLVGVVDGNAFEIGGDAALSDTLGDR